jgi:hypothetical protein
MQENGRATEQKNGSKYVGHAARLVGCSVRSVLPGSIRIRDFSRNVCCSSVLPFCGSSALSAPSVTSLVKSAFPILSIPADPVIPSKRGRRKSPGTPQKNLSPWK